MKKMILLVLLLAIASITAAQISMNVKKTISVPFPKSKVVVTLLALNDGFIAFGDSCEAIKMYYDSARVDTVDYSRDYFYRRPAKAAHRTKENLLFVVGENNLICVSEDNGLSWKWEGNHNFFDDFSLIIESKNELHFISDNDAGVVLTKIWCDVFETKSKIRTTSTEIINLIAGFNINQTPVFVKTVSDNGSVKSSLTTTWNDRINVPRGWKRTETLTMDNDSVIAAIKDNETIKMVSLNPTGNCLITTGIDSIIEKKSTPIYLGDKLLPYGYNFPDGNSFFFGNDKDGKVFALSAENKRNNTNISFKISCLSGTGDTLLLGGENRQVVIVEKLITSLKNQTGKADAYAYFTNNFLNVKATDKEKVTVVNLSGQIMFSAALNGKEAQIDASGWAKGIYLVKIGYKTTKVVK